jgi:O-antigen/teichoic acid export membrane protein
MVLANFSFLDFGFSRASARYVAKELARDRKDLAAAWTWTALISQTFLGLAGALLIYLLAPLIADHIHVHTANRALVILALRLFAFSIPVDFANRSLTGVMQAGQRFDWLNGLSLLSTISTYAAYGLGIAMGNNFGLVVRCMFLLRILNLIGAFYGATRVVPNLYSFEWMTTLTSEYWSRVVALVRYGLWVASVAILGPLLGQFDQWMISLVVGVSLLPFYTIPGDILRRLAFLPSSLTTPLFPAFSAMEQNTEWGRIENYFTRAHRYLFAFVIPIIGVLYIWGEELLRIWIGASFAKQAALPFKLLMPGFLIGLVAPLCGTLLEAIGRPDVLFKLYMVEIPINAALVWFLTKRYAVNGAAMSYTLRTIIETIALWFLSCYLARFPMRRFLRSGVLLPFTSGLVFVPAVLFIQHANIKSLLDHGITILSGIAYCAVQYRLVFDDTDRRFMVNLLYSKLKGLTVKLGMKQKEFNNDPRSEYEIVN